MRLISYATQSGSRVAGRRGDYFVDLNLADPELPPTMRELLALGPAALDRARAAIQAGQPLDPQSIRILAPVPNPEKVICVGLNYADHAAESGLQIPTEPVIFNKFPTAVSGHQAPILLPKSSSQVDYEAELVVVIGAKGRDIPEAQAMDYVAGYACGHDVSARDWQLAKPGGQWLLGKTFDTFAPFGPHLVTADEIDDPGSLQIRLRLNGQILQNSNTSQLIFPIPQLIHYISGVCTLKPGDVIFTGTPPGVGFARKPQIFLQPGDLVEVEIERIGILANPVIAG
jgi:2-keto-4-pentenoate hydratase/2-oxohepta-3-ene-1,7-dioic acid hydratase in catechol pathway